MYDSRQQDVLIRHHEALAKLNPAQQQQLLLQLVLQQRAKQMAAQQQQIQPPKPNSLTTMRSSLADAAAVASGISPSAFSRSPSHVVAAANNLAPVFHRSISQPAGIDMSGMPGTMIAAGSQAVTVAGSAVAASPVVDTVTPALWRSSSCLPSNSSGNL